MSAHVCCGYRFILRLVDPINRVGHATIMKSNSHNEVIVSFRHLLMRVARVEPKVVYYDNQFTFIATVQDEYLHVSLTLMSFSDVMVRERALYILQMQRWIKGFGKKWLRAAVTVQAVTNTLPIYLVVRFPFRHHGNIGDYLSALLASAAEQLDEIVPGRGKLLRKITPIHKM
jgi:hypothetical protein